MADLSGSITSGGTAQTIGSYNPARRGFIFQAGDEDKWIAFGATAITSSPSFYVAAGETLVLGEEFRDLIVRPISVIGATTNSKFTAFDSGV